MAHPHGLFVTIEGLPSREKKTLWDDLERFRIVSENENLHLIPGQHRVMFPRIILHSSDSISELLADTLMRREQVLSEFHTFECDQIFICLDWLACTYAYIHYYLNNADPIGKAYPWSNAYFEHDGLLISQDIPSQIFNLHNLYCQRLYPDISFFVDVPPFSPTKHNPITPEENISTSSDFLLDEFSYEHNKPMGEIPGIENELDFALDRMYKGYLDFGKMCSRYIDELRTPHHMGATKWIPISVDREKPVLSEQVLERIELKGG